MSVQILIGDVHDRLAELPSDSVDCVVTSPPYWGLRDYGTATWVGGNPECQHRVGNQVQDSKAQGAIVAGVRPGVDASICKACGARRQDKQLGLETTYQEHVAVMVAVFEEVRRVLKPEGTLWLNYGDSYATSVNGRSAADTKAVGNDDRTFRDKPFSTVGGVLKPKDLCGIPWRVAFGLQEAGWWLRQDIIWSKPNPMPESVRDRCTKAHEYLFLLSKGPRYYYDAEAIAEAVAPSTVARLSQDVESQTGSDRVPGKTNGRMKAAPPRFGGNKYGDLEGDLHRTKSGNEYEFAEKRNKRSVWEVATQPFSEAHFATFPPELIEPCILAGCPKGGTVLDPFGGAGTTGMVADRLGRNAILIELNPEYAEIAERRIRNDAGMFAEVKAA